METKTKPSFVELIKSLAVLLIIGGSLFMVGYGLFKIGMTLFSSYIIKPMDIIFLFSGLGLLLAFTILVMLGDLKNKSDALARAMTVLIKRSNPYNQGTNINSTNSFENLLEGMFGPKSSTGDGNISGSISIVDLTNPDKPIMQGDFNNINEMKELKDKLFGQMLNTSGELDGKKMTKQEMLNQMSIEQLEAERIKAEETEDWLWAAAVRDKIAEKKRYL